MTITVVHLMRHPDCYRVDRASALGNPFDLTNEAQRPTVVKAHKEYLWEIIRPRFPPDQDKEPIEAIEIVHARYPELSLAKAWRRPTRAEFLAALDRLESAARRGDVAIECWCAPKACHGDNYKGYLEWKIQPAAQNS